MSEPPNWLVPDLVNSDGAHS